MWHGQAAESRDQLSDGFAAAMLYETVADALRAVTGPIAVCRITALHIQFHHAARLGRLTANGRVVWRQGNTACLEARLHDRDGVLVARATGTALVTQA
jgi:acyl-coenzyme A thioesterase PaaI-like protein